MCNCSSALWAIDIKERFGLLIRKKCLTSKVFVMSPQVSIVIPYVIVYPSRLDDVVLFHTEDEKKCI